MSPTPDKDTIYIDAEDEITDIIDKLQSSPSKVVALVLPKRASSLQSIVNLKLLKRTSETAKKNLVLITSDHNLLPLAGVVGLHVAKTPQSKPLIPPAPTMSSDQPLTIEDNSVEQSTATNEEPDLDPKASIGQLAGQVATEETIELDNDEAEALTSKKSSGPKAGKNKKLRVPDFDRFRLLLFGGIGLLLLLIVGLIFALVVLPRAKITIKTDTTTVNVDLNLQASTDAKAVNVDKGIVPALNKQVKKTDSEKVPATGQRDDGTKAKGKVTMSTLTDCVTKVDTVPAGNTVVANNLSFITQKDATFSPSGFQNGKCQFTSDQIEVIAQNAGDKYNLSARTYTVSGFSNISATGSDMSGGTSKITQIVSQQDVDNAKQKVLDRLSPVATTDMKTQFDKDNATGITDTFSAGDPAVTSSPNVNDTGSDVTVNVTVTYSEFGVKSDDLKQVVEAEAKKHIDTGKQSIQDNGLSKAILHATENKSATGVKFELKSLVTAGQQLDADGIKKQIAGKKKGDTQSIIQARPGTKDVTINYSPFWVLSTPKNTKHITIIFEQDNGQ